MERHDITRRDFLEEILKKGIACGTAIPALSALGFLDGTAWAEEGTPKEVTDYEKLGNRRVKCRICPLNCELEADQTCFCRTRTNHAGTLLSHAFSNPCILRLDPIEKLPLNHFHSGTQTLSIATGGCNLRCLYCQNWRESQERPEVLRTYELAPDAVEAGLAKQDVKTIAYTYTEPVAFYEYLSAIAERTHANGVKNVVASAMFINEKPLRQWCRHVDAFSIALKGFTEIFYEKVCGIQLAPVKRAIEIVAEEGVWFELVTLLIPTYNDDRREIEEMCRWVHRTVGPDRPMHFSRFVPEYQLQNLPRTPIATLETARKIALDVGMKYVYTSNVAPHEGNHTYCAGCGEKVIERLGFKVLANSMTTPGRCPKCSRQMPGVW